MPMQFVLPAKDIYTRLAVCRKDYDVVLYWAEKNKRTIVAELHKIIKEASLHRLESIEKPR